MTPPILGIFASAVTGGVSTVSFESISTVTVGSGGSSTIDFTNIPQTFTHLQIRYIARGQNSPYGWDDGNVRLGNGSIDTGSNYSFHRFMGFKNAGASNINIDGGANQTAMVVGVAAGSGASASMFGATVIDILDYANTNKYKTIRGVYGLSTNSTGTQTHGYTGISSGNWRSTNAVTDIRIFFGGNAQQYSHFALYGIKVA